MMVENSNEQEREKMRESSDLERQREKMRERKGSSNALIRETQTRERSGRKDEGKKRTEGKKKKW
jgi:hypothetical protein